MDPNSVGGGGGGGGQRGRLSAVGWCLGFC